MIATITTQLPTTADRVWAAVKRSATFVHVTRGLLGFHTARPLPEEWHVGDVVEGRLLLFDCIPAWRHVLRVVRVDDAARELRTNEGGGPMPVWNHHIRVESLSETACRYTDAVEIQAGVLTPLVWLTAQGFFRYRQRRLRRWLRRAE